MCPPKHTISRSALTHLPTLTPQIRNFSFASSLLRFFASSLLRFFTSSLLHFFTSSLLHFFTSSILQLAYIHLPKLASLHQLDRNLNLLEVDHEQPPSHVLRIHDAELSARIAQHLRFARRALEHRVAYNVDGPLHLRWRRGSGLMGNVWGKQGKGRGREACNGERRGSDAKGKEWEGQDAVPPGY